MTVELRIYEGEVFAKVYALMEREIEKQKERGDEHGVAVTEILLAKIRALERVWDR